jgi:WD40 repeat protein/tRNA A-37 threonylcarbamoyl transferase component Bud32
MGSPQDDEHRIDQLLAEYLQREDAGEAMDRDMFLRRHPDAAKQLAEVLTMGQLIERVLHDEHRQGGAVSPLQGREVAATLRPGQEGADTGVSATGGAAPQESLRFGDFQLLALVARGGMGVVYKARQIKLNRVVALKFIMAGTLANQADVRRFYAEAEAAGKLDHPSIVPVFDVDVHQGQHYLVMAYVEGMSLAKRIVDGPLPPGEAAALMQKVAAAVAYAHEQGVVHRDLKPGNVLVARDGTPRVTDFGLAKRIDQQSSLTATGQVLGTPSYMPPEQAEGRLDEVGPLSDVYALGATLYALLTGRPPFQASTPVDTLRQVLEQQPVPPRRLNPNVPQDLETICLKCLEKEPAARYSSASDAADDLGRHLAGEPITAVPAGALRRAWRWAQRHRVAALQIGLAAVLLLGAIVGLSLYNSQLSSMNARTTNALVAAQTARDDAEREQANAQRQTALAKDAQGKAERVAAELDLALAEKTAALDQLTAAVNRAEEEGQRADRQGVLTTAAQQAAAKAVRSRDLATERQMQVQYVQTIAQATAELKAGNKPRALTLLAATPAACRSWEWDYLRRQCDTDKQERIDATATLWEIIRHPAAVESVVISRNGRWLALAGADGTVRVVNMLTHTERFSANVSDMPLWAVAFDPSSRSLAAAGKGPTIDLWNLREGGEPVHLQSSGGGTHSLAFDSRGLAAGGNDGVIRYWNLTGGGPTLQLREHSAAVTCLDFMYLPGTARMPRGTSLLISVDAQGNARAWYSQGVSQAVAIPFASRVAFAAAGQGQGGGLFLTQGNQRALFGCMVQLVDRYVPKIVWKETTRDGETERVQSTVPAYAGTAPRLVLAPRPILPTTGRTFSISPGGNRIATGNEAAVEVWSMATGKRVKRFTGHKDLVTATAWSPDASLLVSSSRDGSVRIWRLQPGVRRHAVPILAVAFAPAGSRFASADSSGLICVWTHPKGRVETSLSAEREVRAMAFGPRGHFLATIDGGKRLSLWDVEKGKLVESWLPGAGQLTCVAFDPNGRSLAAATTEGQIVIRPLEGKDKPVILKGHRGAVYSVAFRGDGGQLVSAGADSLVRLWNTADWSVVESLEGHDAEILEVAYSPQGDQLASGDRDGAVLLWDPASGSRSGELAAEGRPIRSLCFSHDGARLFTTDSSDRVTVWDTQSQLVVLRLAGQADIRCAAISDDGRMIATGNRNGTVEVWETETADDALRQQFVRAAGLLAERFAICQTMPIADFQNVAATLSDRGYRPTRLRPYQTPEGLSVAAVWARDQRQWRMVVDNGPTALAAEHQKLSKEGFVACDLAGYLYADQKAAAAIRYAALWAKADGPAPPSRIDLGMTGSLTSLEKKRATSGLLAATCQEMIDAKGKRLTSLVWRGATSTAGQVHIDRSKRAAMWRSGLTQLDVAVTHHAGATTYVRLWREGGDHISRELDGSDPEKLAQQFKQLAADGYEPIAVAVTRGESDASLRAASVWQKVK